MCKGGYRGDNGAMQKGGNVSFGPTFHPSSFSEVTHLFTIFTFFIDAKARHIHLCTNMTMAVLNHPPNFRVDNPTVRPFHGFMPYVWLNRNNVLRDSCYQHFTTMTARAQSSWGLPRPLPPSCVFL